VTGPGRRQRVRMPYVERLAERLSARDWSIIETLDRAHLASGLQLERLHFNELTGRSRSVMRWKVLKRLVDARIITSLDRRIGFSQHGSTGFCYVLDSAGQRLVQLQANREFPQCRIRRPRVPGERFVAHTLAVTELYVALVERARLGQLVLVEYQVESAAYWRDGLRAWIKPDAFVKVRQGSVADYWWYEADLATESLPTLRAKMLAYLDFVRRGQLGPEGVMPRVLIGVPTSQRLAAIEDLMHDLPPPADVMFVVSLMPDAAAAVTHELEG
jgi:Replication-relaxation